MGYFHNGLYTQSEEQMEESALFIRAYRDKLVTRELRYTWHPSSGFTLVEVTTVSMGPDRMKVIRRKTVVEEQTTN